MKAALKILFLTTLLLWHVSGFSQNSDSPANDEEFNLFLFSLLLIFCCAMIGAAIIGAMAAALMLFFLFALLSLGVLSTSVAVGLYKRSFSAGFRSFLLITFGLGCGLVGAAGSWIIGRVADLPLSSTVTVLTGTLSGLTGGLLLALATARIVQWVIGHITRRLRLI